MKRAFIVHGWTGKPDEAWFPWLKKELENKGYEVHTPSMPNTNYPEISSWVNYLSEVVGEPDEETYFVGHSIGCQTIMRYAASLNDGSKIGGIVFVAGFFNLYADDYDQEEHDTAKPWLETPIDTDKVKRICPKITAIFSDNDPDVPLSDSEIFKERLGAKIIVENKKIL